VTASAYTSFCSRVLFPLHERMKGHQSSERLRELERSQWWSAQRIRDAQLARLREFLISVGADVPYYRRVFAEHGFVAARMQSLDDLERIPLLTKPLIRANAETLTRPGATDLKRYNTGGSSGEPLIFFIGSDRRSHDVAAKWRATRWWGVDIGDPEIVVWGSPIELSAQDRVRVLRDRILRTELFPAFEMSKPMLDRFIEVVHKRRPRMVFGYPSALSYIAQYAERHAVRLDQLGLRVAFVTSERLYDHQREVIQRVFGCPVANGYGGRDAGFIAHECPSGGLHLSAEDIVVETVGSSGHRVAIGEPGEIVITHMATRDFPFIRYRTGDIGVLGDRECACGRGLPLLREIQGRTTDFIQAVNGTMMHGLALVYTVRDLPGVVEFKIIQHALDRIEVLLVTDSTFDLMHEDRIVRDFKARLGPTVQVTVKKVDRIEPEKSGKFRYVISHVPATRADEKQAESA